MESLFYHIPSYIQQSGSGWKENRLQVSCSLISATAFKKGCEKTTSAITFPLSAMKIKFKSICMSMLILKQHVLHYLVEKTKRVLSD